MQKQKNVIVVNYAKSIEEEIEVLNNYLNENGFKIATYGPIGFGPCPWMFINLDNNNRNAVKGGNARVARTEAAGADGGHRLGCRVKPSKTA